MVRVKKGRKEAITSRPILRYEGRVMYLGVRIDGEHIKPESCICVWSVQENHTLYGMVIAIIGDEKHKNELKFYLRLFYPTDVDKEYSLTNALLAVDVFGFERKIKVSFGPEMDESDDVLCSGLYDVYNSENTQFSEACRVFYADLPPLRYSKRGITHLRESTALYDEFSDLYRRFARNIQGLHSRQYFHSSSFVPMSETELYYGEGDSDIEEEGDGWQNEMWKLVLSDMVDVGISELDFMARWNAHVEKYKRRRKDDMLEEFVRKNLEDLRNDAKLNKNFRILLMVLLENDMIKPDKAFDYAKEVHD